MSTPLAMFDSSIDVDKLNYEIFSILESKFLFGYDDKNFLFSGAPSPDSSAVGKIRILSIDGGERSSDVILAAAALAKLEYSLRRRSGDKNAAITDFFDVAAGSGAGGVLASMLFTKGTDGRALFSAEEALRWFLARRGGSVTGKSGFLKGIFRRSGGLRRVFGEATMKDTVKAVLIPCFDLATGAPFLFSRADAVESDGYDFRMAEVCAATCAGDRKAVELRSVDGRTRIVAVGGGVAMGNPTAAAITHVLNNKHEFPGANGVEDLAVVSLGSCGGVTAVTGRSPCAAELVRIAVDSAADMVDQAVAMAFGHSRASNYIRIQANGFGLGNSTPKKMSDGRKVIGMVDDILVQRNVESTMFRGKKVSEETNIEKLEYFANELIKEEDRRKKSSLAAVVLKQVATPRTSSATPSTIITQTTSTRSSTSPSH